MYIYSTYVHVHVHVHLAFEHQITIAMMSRTDCPELTTWVKELGLTCADEVDLQNGSWLSANHMSAANRLLKRHFPGDKLLTHCSYFVFA